MNSKEYIKFLASKTGISENQLQKIFLDSVCKIISENNDKFELPLKLKFLKEKLESDEIVSSSYLNFSTSLITEPRTITFKFLAERWGVNRGTISKWQYRKINPMPDIGISSLQELDQWFKDRKSKITNACDLYEDDWTKLNQQNKTRFQRGVIKEFLEKSGWSRSTFDSKIKKGMPHPRDGATYQECMEWDFDQRHKRKTALAKRFGVSRGTIETWIDKDDMPDPNSPNVRLRDILNWHKAYLENKNKGEYTFFTLCKETGYNIKTLRAFVNKEGMPHPKNGATSEQCNQWLFQHKTTDARIASMLEVSTAEYQKFKKIQDFPTPQSGASFDEIKSFVNRYPAKNFPTYEASKVCGLCKKSIAYFVRRGMPDPRSGASVLAVKRWIESTFDDWPPIYKLVRTTGKSLDTLTRYIKKDGMPDPRNGVSFKVCFSWVTQNATLSEYASKFKIQLNTFRNWVIKHGCPDPRQGATNDEIVRFIEKNYKKLRMAKNVIRK